MKLIRKFAVQGHDVPETAHSPVGPFPPEILVEPKKNYEEAHQDSLHEALDSTRFFRCRDCTEVLHMSQLDTHACGD